MDSWQGFRRSSKGLNSEFHTSQQRRRILGAICGSVSICGLKLLNNPLNIVSHTIQPRGPCATTPCYRTAFPRARRQRLVGSLCLIRQASCIPQLCSSLSGRDLADAGGHGRPPLRAYSCVILRCWWRRGHCFHYSLCVATAVASHGPHKSCDRRC